MHGLLGAVRFLTRLPVPGTDSGLDSALVWFPWVGLILGLVLAGVDVGLHWLRASTLLDSVVLVVLLLAFTGAIHADGLIDTCDAVFGHATPERRLEIMRDPRAGAFGIVGFVSVFALKVTALADIEGSYRVDLIALAPVLGRWAIVLVTTLFPYGRTTGLGAPLKSAATPKTLAIASVLPVAGCLLVGPTGVALGVLAGLTAVGTGRWLVTLLPGLTGDCYGAICEMTEAVIWLGGALMVPWIAA